MTATPAVQDRLQELYLKIIKRDEWKCRDCDSTGTLVLHCVLNTKKPLWELKETYLMALCPSCQQRRYEAQKTINLSVLEILRGPISRVQALAQSLKAKSTPKELCRL